MNPRTRIVWTAILADLLIAAAKFIAAGFTGSSAMLSEGIHSMVDTGNGALVLLGWRRSRRPPDEEHPFGYGQELAFWTLIVAMGVFAGGGIASIYQGILHLMHPRLPENLPWAYAILGISLASEGYSLSVAYRNFRASTREEDLWPAIHFSKDPSMFSVLFEDSAAIAGLILAFLGLSLSSVFKTSFFDSAASIGIGLILLIAAAVLANETRGLLIGEAVRGSTLARISEIAQADPAVERIRRPVTMYFGPDTILLALDIQFHGSISAREVTDAVDRIEKGIQTQFPLIRHIYIEAEAVSGAARKLGST